MQKSLHNFPLKFVQAPFLPTFCIVLLNFACEGTIKKTKTGKSASQGFVCKRWNYSSTQDVILKRHKLKHSGERPFVCAQCNFSCTQTGYLKRHMLKHSGEKPFLCRQCDFRCTRDDSLKKHMLTHSGERPFVCKQCNYSFSATCYLKKHMLTHSGVRPFFCKQFNYSFKKNWSAEEAHADTFVRKVFHLHTVQLYLHTRWWPQKTHSDPFGGKKPSAAHSVNSPALQPLTSRNTC